MHRMQGPGICVWFPGDILATWELYALLDGNELKLPKSKQVPVAIDQFH